MALTKIGNYREEIDKLLCQYIFNNARNVSRSQSDNY